LITRVLLERALMIDEKAGGQTHRDTNRTRSHLARLLVMGGQPTEALALGKTALAAHDKVLGITLGPKTAPASPRRRSTRLAAPRRRRRCGRSMGSPSLRA